MKILITGAGGMLAADMISVLGAHEPVPLTRRQLDITDAAQTAAAVAAHRPGVIINCAAFTKVDACETEAATAYAVNADGPGSLVSAAAAVDAALVHISTDYVFDGRKRTPYTETDATAPLCVYGDSKLRGEQHVSAYARHYIVRTQWLYGHGGGNFVKTMLRLSAERDALKVVSDQYGSPTYTRDLAVAIGELITTGAYGTYHITNTGCTSWYGFAAEIFALAGRCVRLVPCATHEYPLPAKRPEYAPLENRNWLALGKAPLRGYREALKEYLLGL